MKLSAFSPILWVRLFCGAAAAGMVIWLLAARKPWDILEEIGQPVKIRHFAAIYEWWAAAINALIFGILALTAPWWFRHLPETENSKIPNPKWFWPLVLAAMALTAFFGWQRISYSLWDDEDSSLRRVILGEYRPDKNGGITLKESSWEDAFWNYRKPANHQLQTLLSKASLELWRAAARPGGLQFTEAVVRLPGYLAGILSIGALALLLKKLGFPRAGVVAAFLLALHPWHIRYTAELRGYIFTLLFGPLMLYCLLQAIDNGRWRWWLAFALSEFALLYAYPGCLYMLVAANGCGLIALWFRHETAADRAVFVPRMIVASLAAGMIYLQLMMPCLPQLTAYLKTDRALGVLDTRWHFNMLGHLTSGIPWNNSDNASAGYPELLWQMQSQPWLKAVLLFLPAVLLMLGIARLLAARPRGWVAAVTLLVPALAVYAVSRKNNNYLYEWYLIFVLPGLTACVALGADWPMRLLERSRWSRPLIPTLLTLVIGGFFLGTNPARSYFLSHPLQPIKDVVLRMRPSLDPNDPRQQDILTVGLGVHLESYDAHVLSAETIDELSQIARQADISGKTLYVVTGNDIAVSVDYPALRTFIREGGAFESFAVLPGLDPTLTQTIWRYKSGSLSPAAR